MEGKYLPIGTVVIFKGCLRPVMIIGYLFYDEKIGLKDYVATVYPEGYIDENCIMAFNHNDIKLIMIKGYTDNFYVKLNKKLNEIGGKNEITGY